MSAIPLPVPTLVFCFLLSRLKVRVHQQNAPPPPSILIGKTGSLILRLTKKLHGTGKILVLDSGSCVLQGLVDIKKKGIYGATIGKKRRYFPRYINGEKIKPHFTDKAMGAVDALHDELENVPLCVFAMKEEGCDMMIMSTHETNKRVCNYKFRTIGGKRISSRYPETMHNHY